nr:hypothetical protein GCM10025732_26090 [Glycomyces mayteni]
MAVEVTDAPDRHRWEARIDGELVGFAQYEREDGAITFFHTEVEREGAGVGTALVRASLDAARGAGSGCTPCAPSTPDGSSATPSTATSSTTGPRASAKRTETGTRAESVRRPCSAAPGFDPKPSNSSRIGPHMTGHRPETPSDPVESAIGTPPAFPRPPR